MNGSGDNTLASLSRKEERFVDDGRPVISDRSYNLAIGLVILYGIVVNALICNFCAGFVLGINPIALIIGYIVLVIAGSLIAYSSKNPAISFLGYNMIVLPLGAVLTVMVQQYDSDVVFHAFIMTALITAIMLVASTIWPEFFIKLGGVLFIGLIGIIVANLIFGLLLRWDTGIIAIAASAIFSLYIGYDWSKAQRYRKTLDNAVDSAIDIYMDIILLFMYLLEIFGRRN